MDELGSDGEELLEQFKDIIRSTLPFMKDGKVEELATGLILDQGARSASDLQHIDNDYLRTLVSPVDSSKLHNKFQSLGESISLYFA